jgi:hypothetical protein
LAKRRIKVTNGGGGQSLGERFTPTPYLSVFIPHFLGSPAQNSGILRKLYVDFNLSKEKISQITGWSRTSIGDALSELNIRKKKEIKK